MTNSATNTYQLLIDTTNNYCLLGLLDNHTLIGQSITPTHNNLTELVTQLVHDLLASHGVGYQALDQIYVVIGPGSFTGVKVGVSIAKTICAVYPAIQVYQIDSASIVANFDGLGYLDAKSHAYYVIGYRNHKVTTPLQLVTQSQLDDLLTQYPVVHDLEHMEIQTYFDHLVSNLDHFQICQDVKDLLPAYVKPVLYQPQTK